MPLWSSAGMALCAGRLPFSSAGVATMGIPGTIENDIYGTDVAIGVDTALNTALDAIDRIKDTASAHQQVFLIEMMGEKSGYLALMAGLAGGAEVVCIPEVPFTLEEVAADVADAYVRGKTHCIIIVSEGAVPHAAEIAEYLRAKEQETGFGVRLSILGHIQRGRPSYGAGPPAGHPSGSNGGRPASRWSQRGDGGASRWQNRHGPARAGSTEDAPAQPRLLCAIVKSGALAGRANEKSRPLGDGSFCCSVSGRPGRRMRSRTSTSWTGRRRPQPPPRLPPGRR